MESAQRHDTTQLFGGEWSVRTPASRDMNPLDLILVKGLSHVTKILSV